MHSLLRYIILYRWLEHDMGTYGLSILHTGIACVLLLFLLAITLAIILFAISKSKSNSSKKLSSKNNYSSDYASSVPSKDHMMSWTVDKIVSELKKRNPDCEVYGHEKRDLVNRLYLEWN